MGGEFFGETVPGHLSAEEAFDQAVVSAREEFGAGAYSGTIGTKLGVGFEIIEAPPDGGGTYEWEDNQIDRAYAKGQGTHIAGTKWGPALCYEIRPGVWRFFGKAPA